ncbi:MAG: OAM dimerization domain-containing protein, partial [Bacilli bacterium]|nr:OAM dimerization domain-containing protein [Bacilli bacterium]
LLELVEVRHEGYMKEKVRELKERAALFFEELLAVGGYFNAVELGFFIDSGIYPERNGDGISRKINGGVGAGTIYKRDSDYLAPVTAHFGYNNTSQYNSNPADKPSSLIKGCTFEDRSKIQYIDELDEIDNVNKRIEENEKYRNSNLIKPEVEWLADGTLVVDLTLPTTACKAEYAAIEIGKRMNLADVEVIHKEILHNTEATRIQIKGRIDFDIDLNSLVIPPPPSVLSDEEIREFVKIHPFVIVAATVGEDEHSVGLREIIDIKHGGIEKYGIMCEYLGTSVPIEKLVDAAIELNADAILMSTIISHNDIHYKNMKKTHEYAIEKGVRDRLIIIAGGTQVTPEIAVKQGVDAGFGRGTRGEDVATFLVKRKKEMLKL